MLKSRKTKFCLYCNYALIKTHKIISLYGPPAWEMMTLDSQTQQLNLNHVYELGRIADVHYQHLTTIAVLFKKLLDQGVTDMDVIQNLDVFEIKIKVRNSIFQEYE